MWDAGDRATEGSPPLRVHNQAAVIPMAIASAIDRAEFSLRIDEP
jgi:hypothetical protein